MSDEPIDEAGYHRLERQQLEGHRREGDVAAGAIGVAALVLEPLETLFGTLFGWLFGSGDEDDDDEPAPDYSMAERIPEGDE